MIKKKYSNFKLHALIKEWTKVSNKELRKEAAKIFTQMCAICGKTPTL